MSQLLCRIITKQQQGLCIVQSRRSLSTAATPYLLLKETWKKRSESGERVVDLNLYDPTKGERFEITDQAVSKDLFPLFRIGSSRGWLGTMNVTDKTVRLTNIVNPSASVSSHRVITLPPLDDTRVSSIALSASPNNQGEDFVVAVKSRSPFISLCRPGDEEWTRVEVPFFAAEVMYSDRDKRFYLHKEARKKEEEEEEENVYNGPYDLITTNSSFPQVSLYQRFPLSDIPKERQDQLASTYKLQRLVESPYGDSFIVYWCEEFMYKREEETKNKCYFKTKAFVVYRQDCEEKVGAYTEDIGDLCIFLGRNGSESFCISAADHPGLKPNSVYFARYHTKFGFYDLSTNTLHDFIEPSPFSDLFTWLAPLQKSPKPKV